MYCKSCGKQLNNGVKFCKYCGKSVIKDGPTNFEQGIEEIEKSEEKSDGKFVEKINKRNKFIFRITLGIIAIIILYIIFTDSPFSFISGTRRIDPDVITSSVVNIMCEARDGDVYGGSGTIITTEGIIITNSHIIPQDEENLLILEEGCLVILPDRLSGQPKEVYWGQPIVIPELSDRYDLAYIEIYDVYKDGTGKFYGLYPKTFPSIFAEAENYDKACLSSSNIKLGDMVRIYGYPLTSGGLNLTITDGVISSLLEDGSILTSAKVDEGNSGGIAVDQNGCMIGIPSAITEGTYQNLGVIIPVDLILEFSEEVEKLLESSE